MLWKIFAAAVVIRWTYALSQFAMMGDAGLESLDSTTYLADAHHLAQAITAGTLHGGQWLGFGIFTMPLYGWFIGLHALFFGKMTALAFVITQGLLDSGTCLLIYGVAKTLNPRIATAAAIMAALNPTQIVLSALVYTDTTFLFFVTLSLLATAQWLRAPLWSWAALAGVALGAATLTRAIAAPWTIFLVLFLFVVVIVRGQLNSPLVGQIILIATIFAFSIGPVLWRNVSQYGAWSLTSQEGIYLAYWIVPLTKEAKDGTPWAVTYAEIQKAVEVRFPDATDNPFDQSQRDQLVAREKLAELGIVSIAKAWIYGAVINMASPAIALSPVVANLPRTGFFATKGTSMQDKAFNFLFHSDNAIYASILLISIAGLAAVRLVQTVGVWTLIRQWGGWPISTLLFFWVSYILTVNGPIASPKYRLPIEPVLMVLAGAGICRIQSRWRQYRHVMPIER